MKVEKRINEIVNRLNKTKEEKFPNLRDEREERDRLEREDGKQKLREQVTLFFQRISVLVFYSFTVTVVEQTALFPHESSLQILFVHWYCAFFNGLLCVVFLCITLEPTRTTSSVIRIQMQIS